MTNEQIITGAFILLFFAIMLLGLGFLIGIILRSLLEDLGLVKVKFSAKSASKISNKKIGSKLQSTSNKIKYMIKQSSRCGQKEVTIGWHTLKGVCYDDILGLCEQLKNDGYEAQIRSVYGQSYIVVRWR